MQCMPVPRFPAAPHQKKQNRQKVTKKRTPKTTTKITKKHTLPPYSPIRTTMEGTRLGRGAHNNLHATIRRVVLPRAFFAIHMAEGVSIGLDELVVGNELGEMGFPELLGPLQIQTLQRKKGV